MARPLVRVRNPEALAVIRRAGKQVDKEGVEGSEARGRRMDELFRKEGYRRTKTGDFLRRSKRNVKQKRNVRRSGGLLEFDMGRLY